MKERIPSVLYFCYKNRLLVFIITLAVIAAMAVNLTKLVVDNSFDVWFVDDDPALASYQTFREIFGSDEVVVTTITDSSSVFTCERMERIASLVKRIRSIDGVTRAMSIHDMHVPFLDSTGLSIVDVGTLVCLKKHSADRNKLLMKVKKESRFVSDDEKTVAIFTWLDTLKENDARRGKIINTIDSCTARAVDVSGRNINHGGFGVVFNALNDATIHEGFCFIILSYAVIVIFLLLVTRSLLWSGIALLSVTGANITMFGIMSICNRPVTMVSMALPPLLIVLGVANIIHISGYLHHAAAPGGRDVKRTIAALSVIIVPCIFNALTTAGGFLSLGTARMAVTRDYGIFAATGVIAALAFSTAGTIVFLKKIPSHATGNKKLHNCITKIVTTAMLWSSKYKKTVCIIFLILMAASLIAASHLVVDTYSIDFLPGTHRVAEDSRLIEKKIGNYLPLEFLISLHDGVSYKSEEVFDVLNVVHERCKGIEHIDGMVSIADYQRQVAELAAMAAFAGDSNGKMSYYSDSLEKSDLLCNFVSKDKKTLRFTAWVSMASAKELAAIADSVLAVARPILAPYAEIQPSGYLPLYGRMIENVMTDQIHSFSLALAVIVILIGIVLRTPKMVLMALPSNLFPVAILFGFMGCRGIRLDIATVTIAAAVLGIIVDDTVHILYTLQQQLREDIPFESAVKNVAQKTGVAVVSTSIILMAGFIVISFSGMKSIAYTGILTAIAVFTALIADILLLPGVAAIVCADKKKKNLN